MHGLTGGGWKRSDLATVTGVAQPTGKPAATKAPGPTARHCHRASPRPYTKMPVTLGGTAWPTSRCC